MRPLAHPMALALALSALPTMAAPQSGHFPTGEWHLVGLGSGKAAPELGDLKVDTLGGYQWSENHHVAGLGTLVPHRPASGARSGQDCWRYHRAKGDVYVIQEGANLEVYDAASNTLIGKGMKSSAKAAPKRR